ncbi:MAG: hypothetical protein JWO32_899 [Bacteroidetes bacterium]|nr:hypothetical protein [Bacteroidota bacterium]
MSKEEIIKDIRENFEELSTGKNDSKVKTLINTISRQAARLQLKDKSTAIRIHKLMLDLKTTEAGEAEFYKLKKQGAGAKMQYSDSFYDAITLLKNDLFKILSAL